MQVAAAKAAIAACCGAEIPLLVTAWTTSNAATHEATIVTTQQMMIQIRISHP
jgi:uncharacterized membrane protein